MSHCLNFQRKLFIYSKGKTQRTVCVLFLSLCVCTVLYCTILYCTVLRWAVLCCTMLRYLIVETSIWFSTLAAHTQKGSSSKRKIIYTGHSCRGSNFTLQRSKVRKPAHSGVLQSSQCKSLLFLVALTSLRLCGRSKIQCFYLIESCCSPILRLQRPPCILR